MELESKLKEDLATQPAFTPENHSKSSPKDDEFPFEANASKGFLQDFSHLDHFHVNGSSSNAMFGVQTSYNYEPFDAFPYGYSSNFDDFYESKPFDNNGHGQVMDNFQSGGYNLSFSHRNPINYVGSDQGNLPYNLSNTVPDEVSCVSNADNGYYKRAGLTKQRTMTSTKRTWKSRKKSSVVKGQWTLDEDRRLIQLVQQYGVRKWSSIAQLLPGRVGKQCRERWHNHLRPDIKKDTWSEEEDKVLIQAHAQIGNKWAEIAKRLPGRTENSIKNHWNATKRRQYSKRKCRSKYPRGTLLQEYIKSLNLDSPNMRSSYHQQQTPTFNHALLGINNTTYRAPNHQLQPLDYYCPSDRLAPNFDFSEIPDFCFDDKMFEDSCSIDSLLDEMPCPPGFDDKSCDEQMDMNPLMDFKVKKEMDLVEMISQANM